MNRDISSAPRQAQVGILGTGKMGFGIASRLLAQGLVVRIVVDADKSLSPNKRALLDAGAEGVATPAVLAATSHVVLTCLTDSDAVRTACSGADGLLAASRPGLIHIDHTSGAPHVTKRLADAYALHGGALVDAAMLRTPQAAADGDLVLLTGGPAALLAQLDPFLALYSSERIHAGDVGSGQSLKLLSSFVGLGMSAVIAEIFDIARGTGIGIDLLHRAISGTGADSRTFQALATIAMKEDATDGDKGGAATRQFSIALAAKDLRYLSDLAHAQESTGTQGTAPKTYAALSATIARLQRTIDVFGPDAPLSNVGLRSREG